MNSDKYQHKDSWKRHGKDFCIEVVRWNAGPTNIWNVYCYIYPGHRLFDELKNEFVDFENLHGGCTYNNWYYDSEGNVKSKCYGCDYNHYYDTRYTVIKSAAEAHSVFNDADKLFEELSE